MRNNFLKSLLYSYGSVIFTSLIGFITLPLSLNYFGKDLFGLFSITNDTLAYLALFNFGIPWATATIFAKLLNYRAQKELLFKSLKLLFLLCVFMTCIVNTIALLYSDWIHFIAQINSSILPSAKLFISISVIFFIIRLPFSLFGQLLIFINRVYISKIIDILSSMLTFSSLLAVINFKLTIVQYAIISGFISLLPLFLSILLFIRIWRREALSNLVYNSEYTSYRHLMSSSFYFFLNGVGGLIIWNTDSLVISHYLGLGETAEYAVMFKFFTILFMIITQIMNVVNPLFPKFVKEGKRDKLSQLFNVLIRIFPVVGGFIFIIMFGFFKEFVILWTHNSSIFIGSLSCFAMGLYCYFLCSSVVPYSAIVSLNYAKEIYKLTLLEAIVNLVLSIYLVIKIGIAGVVFGTLIAHVVTMFILVPLKLDKLMPNLFKFDFLFVMKHILFAIIPVSCMIYYLNMYSFDFMKVLLSISVFIFYFVVSSIIVGKKSISEILQLIKVLK
ncbi:MAG: oligosaccharide flippase family protein [Burkholderiales bacterium]|nr:oligosaccharide flippase family protein [Burkholderiales bacterium]